MLKFIQSEGSGPVAILRAGLTRPNVPEYNGRLTRAGWFFVATAAPTLHARRNDRVWSNSSRRSVSTATGICRAHSRVSGTQASGLRFPRDDDRYRFSTAG